MYGPYDTPQERDGECRKCAEENGLFSHGYFKLSTTGNPELNIGCYLQGELE
jgi:hypothetical protein